MHCKGKQCIVYGLIDFSWNMLFLQCSVLGVFWILCLHTGVRSQICANDPVYLCATKENKLDKIADHMDIYRCVLNVMGGTSVSLADWCRYHTLYLTLFRIFGSFRNEPMQSCSVRRVVLSSVYRFCHRRHRCHLCTALPVTALFIETSYLANICIYTPSICT